MNTVKRLIETFIPEAYSLTLQLSKEAMTFSGDVRIEGATTQSSKSIFLHASELSIVSITAQQGGSLCEISKHIIHNKDQLVEIVFSKPLPEGKITLALSFSAAITKPMHGLYPCFYEMDGKKEVLLATQFESHHAREVFPCIDEPEAKATFELTLTTLRGDEVLSNTPISTQVTTGDTVTTTFEKTPIMSTYLLAFVTGPLVHVAKTMDDGTLVGAYATPLHAKKLDYALDVALRATQFLNDYFAIPYPLPKLDIVALPDFAAGAMENWGLITFREGAMLIDEKDSDLLDKQHVAEVVIHELAHQWFGNLVTMRWWNDLWLNEGFASFVPYIVINELFPEWNIWEAFASTDLVAGLKSDALENTHPIVVRIHNPEEIRSAFDTISYSKGCSVINLVYRFIGPEAFRKGLQNYLKKHAYGNTETSDLWQAWSESSGKDILSFMKEWTEKPGFPIITVQTEEKHVTLQQQRFFVNPEHPEDSTIWPIPLLQSDTDDTLFATKTMNTATLGKLNVGQSGFYRVVYDEKSIKAFSAQIEQAALPALDVLGLITDSAEAAKAGYYSSTQTIDLLQLIKKYTNEKLLNTALAELAAIRLVMPELHEELKPLTANIIADNVERLGLDPLPNDSTDDELMRPSVLASASYAGNREVIDWALAIFSKAEQPEDIRPDIRSLCYQAAVREYGDHKTFDKLLNWYTTTTLPGEHPSLAAALVSFSDEAIIASSLDLISSPSVKLQDVLYWLMYALNGRYSRAMAWNWLKSNWDWIGENFSRDKEVDYFLKFAANGFATKQHLEDYIAFFTSVSIFGSERAFKQGQEIISWQTKWKERDSAAIAHYLSSQK